MKRYTRRDAIKLGVVGLGALAIGASASSCGGGESGGQAGQTSLDLLADWTYLGPPGGVERYWNEIKARLSTSDEEISLDQVTVVPFEDLLPAVQTQARAKSGPGVAAWYSDYFGYRLVAQDFVAPIDGLVSEDEKSHWLLAETKWGGKYWGVPHTLEIQVLAINRRLFEKAGIEVEEEFESHEHFIEACDRLKAAGITPIQAGTSDGSNAQKWHLLEQLQAAESPTDITKAVLGEISVDAPAFARGREWLPVLGKYMNPHPESYTEQMAVDAFLKGKAGMACMNTAPVFAEGVGSEFDIVGFPASGAAYSRPTAGAGDTLVVMAHEENKEAVGRFIEFLHRPEQLQLWWETTRTLPADDRFDVSGLPSIVQRTWDLVRRRPGDPFALWYPDNFYPVDFVFSFYLPVPAGLISGRMNADQARAKTEEVFKKFRDQNPKELEEYRDFSNAISQIVSEQGQ